MPFKFSWLCELLDELYHERHQRRATHARQDDPYNPIVTKWFRRHNDKIVRNGPSAVVFLTSMFPERRPDRVYSIKETRLSSLFGRALGLGTSRLQRLRAWQAKDGLDFASCLEGVMAECEHDPPHWEHEVTLEEVDAMLERFVTCPSALSAARKDPDDRSVEELLGRVIRRLRSSQAKWLARMFLKSYSPVEVPEYTTLAAFHFMLPKILSVQNSLHAAVTILSRPELQTIPHDAKRELRPALLSVLEKTINPELGVMVKRQPYDKARSIRHCAKMAGTRVMSVDRKYDGEYCQIHIDVSKNPHCIQIFSKSGKDSTQDRFALHTAIRSGLKLGSEDCKIRHRAILEGELVVYSRSQRQILPFHHIRKHVLHGGRRIGCETDSPRKGDQTLMIVFFDILLLDHRYLLNETHKKRRSFLKALVTPLVGLSELCEHILIDFSSRKAPEILRHAFARAIRHRWEGYVLKGSDDPYLSWTTSSRCIKLKKDYIAGLGDSADLCIVGGHREAKLVAELNIGDLKWTHFHVACLLNKSEVKRFSRKPHFRILDVLGSGSMSPNDILALNTEAQYHELDIERVDECMKLDLARKDLAAPTSLFKKPLVVEIMGAGFERPQTVNFYVIRLPRRVGSKIRIHQDRDICDTVDFDELQVMAQHSIAMPVDADSQEDAEWIARLEAAEPKIKYIQDYSQSTSPSKTQTSASTALLTPSREKPPSSSAPAFVRVDTSELTLKEKEARYPRRYETPERESEKTPSPPSSASSDSQQIGSHKRALVEITSPDLDRAGKRVCTNDDKHVRFADENQVRAVANQAAQGVESPPVLIERVTDATEPRRRETRAGETDSGNPGDEWVEVCMLRSSEVCNEVSCGQRHPRLKPLKSAFRSAVKHQSMDIDSTADDFINSQSDEDRDATFATPMAVTSRSTEPAINIMNSRPSTPSPAALSYDPTLAPILLTSATHQPANIQSLVACLTRTTATFTFSPIAFTSHLLIPRKPQLTHQTRYIALIDTDTKSLCTAISDLQDLCGRLDRRAIPQTDTRTRITVTVYDWRVLSTEVARHNFADCSSVQSTKTSASIHNSGGEKRDSPHKSEIDISSPQAILKLNRIRAESPFERDTWCARVDFDI